MYFTDGLQYLLYKKGLIDPKSDLQLGEKNVINQFIDEFTHL